MPTLHGIVVYTIEKNNCLNAVYANDSTPIPHELYTETARLQAGQPIPLDNISGNYDSVWIDAGNNIVQGRLEITRQPNEYLVNWFDGTRHAYTGFGFLIRDNQFVVSYHDLP